ncbi:MAG: AsnC family transcriptional regulator [Thaumarchaeota archaeon]|nr:MAG: AsnC family transcriptional regulator [Nitrososphaerota archaeon]
MYMLLAKYYNTLLQQVRVDGTDLQIIRLLARDSRTPYKSIAADVGITSPAAKERINKMISSGVIERFVVLINPIIFGYEKLCVLIVKNIDKTTIEQDIFKKLSLLGDLVAYSEELEGSYIFRLYVKDITQYKIETVTDLLKPATVEAFFADFSPPPTMKIHSSDLEIMKCLLSDARKSVEKIGEETSLSPKTVARRLDKMRRNYVSQFTISRNLTSMRLTGYMEFDVLIHVELARHKSVLEKIYRELDEYFIFIPAWYQREVIVAVFFCANISTTKLILRRLESYNGVNKVESFIRTSITIDQNWLKREIDKRITTNQNYLSSSAAATIED